MLDSWYFTGNLLVLHRQTNLNFAPPEPFDIIDLRPLYPKSIVLEKEDSQKSIWWFFTDHVTKCADSGFHVDCSYNNSSKAFVVVIC